MSQIPMTETERARALQSFGYTETEARFLCRAALHGGYFLRRQYSCFLGREDGGSVTQLVQKALALGHARASTWRQNTQLYHLCARPFYEALGQSDNRNRRMRELSAIRQKVMGLDFVLAHPDERYLATELEKVEHFTKTLQIPYESLPGTAYRSLGGHTTVRYFVEKFPIFLCETSGSPPVASFCFVDEGLAGLTAFESFLKRYSLLFGALNALHVVYVAAKGLHFEAAQKRFVRLTKTEAGSASDVLMASVHLQDLLEYFDMRRRYEAGQFDAFDRQKLIALRDARQAFSGKEFEAFFGLWKVSGDAAVADVLRRQKRVTRPILGTFSTYLLEHDYGLFATVVAA